MLHLHRSLPAKTRFPETLSISNFNLQRHSNFNQTPLNKPIPFFFLKTKEHVSSVFISTTAGKTTTNPEMSAAPRRPIPTTRIHIMALDGIVNVNSLFSFALFVGLTLYPTTDPATMLIGSATTCAAGSASAEGLIAFHVYSFSSFLFSSLVALAVKQVIKIGGDNGDGYQDGGYGGGDDAHLGRVNRVALRVGTLVSAFGSVFGCGFLMMALVELVQIKLGKLSCRNFYTLAAIGPLVTLVPLALVIYVFLVLHAFTR